MTTIAGIIRNGQIHPVVPLAIEGQKHCLVTILDEDLDELRRLSNAMLDDARQNRLSWLLAANKSAQLTPEQERELDGLLTEVHQLTAKRARAARLLEQLHLT